MTRPFLIDLVERNLDEYLEHLQGRAREGWVPNAAAVCYEPKGAGLVRPGGVLQLDDDVYYNVLVGEMHTAIRDGLAWSQGDPDIAYQLSSSSDDEKWILDWRALWKRWRELSSQRLATSAFMVVTDISGCYENVDLQRLSSELRSLGCEPQSVSALSTCLNRWATPRGRGIPQGYSASDILAKVYLSTVDGRLQSVGLSHLRYVDDIRVFCQQHGKALQAVQTVTETLAGCGLNIQSAKTHILEPGSPKAREEIDGVALAIEGVQNALLDEIADLALGCGAITDTDEIASTAYATFEELEEIARASPEAPTVEILERAWADHVTPETVQTLSKTLLRYLLPRLAVTRSRVAMELLPQIIRDRPEELETCLRYLSRSGAHSDIAERLPDLVDYDGYVYDRSLFWILRWAWLYGIRVPRLLELARGIATDRNRASWTRAYAWAITGRCGQRSDLDLLADLYSNTTDEVERSELVCCTARMELSRRNAFLSRVAGECMWTQWASQAVRSGALDSLMAPHGPE